MLNTLNVAQSGLASAQVQVENVMNNIANENTIGYKKRVVDVKEAPTDSRLTGRGTVVNDVSRIVNIYVYESLITEQSKNSQYNELSNMLADVEAIFYETSDSGLSSDLDKYFQSIEDLRANPFNEIYRSNLSNSGEVLVDDLKTLYSDLDKVESIANKSLKDSLDDVNSLLRDIGKVNKQITDSVKISNELYDERDLLESKLSQYVPIDIDRTDGYVLSIGGVEAIRYDTNIHDLKIKHNKIAQKDIYANINNTSNLVNNATWGAGDSITYYLNKEDSITITHGDTFTNSNGAIQNVDVNNIVQALVSKINNDPQMTKIITAYNGQPHIDENGNEVLFQPQTNEHYLILESKVKGFDGKLNGRIIVNDDNNLNINGNQVSNLLEKSSLKSKNANDEIYFEIYDEPLNVTSGKTKAILDNVNTKTQENKYVKYKEMLDDFAKSLSDFTKSYIDKGEHGYVSGEKNSLLDYEKANSQFIGLFEGASVDNLKFNKAVVNNLTQDNLDYLASMQWNDEISIGRDSNTTTSFTKFYEKIRVTISQDKEKIDYLKETQNVVTKSLQLNYDKLTKVNKDDELVNLIKFQSAYEANAKLITIVDEMLATILGMKR